MLRAMIFRKIEHSRPRATAPRVLKGAAVAAGLAAALSPVAASAASAVDLYYERTLMSAAHQRCHLFTPAVAAALDASAAQARGAALRAGVDANLVRTVGQRAQTKAGSVACNSPDLQTAAARVRTAFDGWSRITRMSFPGETAGWSADRTAYSAMRWRLVQNGAAGADPAAFGIAGQGQETSLVAVVRFADGARPYTARLVFRDAGRAPAPWLGAPNSRPLPPRSASSVLLAQSQSVAPQWMGLGYRKTATSAPPPGSLMFRFPGSAVQALAGLDPRERFAVEFVMPDDSVRVARFEVGDFAAGRAFLMVGG